MSNDIAWGKDLAEDMITAYELAASSNLSDGAIRTIGAAIAISGHLRRKNPELFTECLEQVVIDCEMAKRSS
jgi:hypothetical protein